MAALRLRFEALLFAILVNALGLVAVGVLMSVRDSRKHHRPLELRLQAPTAIERAAQASSPPVSPHTEIEHLRQNFQ